MADWIVLAIVLVLFCIIWINVGVPAWLTILVALALFFGALLLFGRRRR